jgi:hypothetical protein
LCGPGVEERWVCSLVHCRSIRGAADGSIPSGAHGIANVAGDAMPILPHVFAV